MKYDIRWNPQLQEWFCAGVAGHRITLSARTLKLK
jgi:hypothetical protein